MSFEQAATFGLGAFTCGQGLYQNMVITLPYSPAINAFTTHQSKVENKNPKLLIYGGSTSTGIFAIQLATLSSFEVLTTCSPHNFELVRRLGAKRMYDYRSETCGWDTKRDTENELFYAYDCIGTDGSARICAEALSSCTTPSGRKAKYGTVMRNQFGRADVDVSWSLVFSALGEAFSVKTPDGQVVFELPAKPEDFEFAKEWAGVVEKLVGDGKLKPPPVKIGKGFEAVVAGIEEIKTVGGVRLVYSVP